MALERRPHLTPTSPQGGSAMAKSILERFEAKVIPCPMTGCWLWCGATRNYGVMRIGQDGPGSRVSAHRLAWELFNGVIHNGLCVLHRCDVPQCVNPAHLFLGTVLDNNTDRTTKGRSGAARGEHHPSAKLTNEQVIEIRGMRGSLSSIARKFCVDKMLISRIKRRKSWGHI